MTTRFHKPEYIKRLGESGLKVFFLMTNTDWLRPGRDYTDENGIRQHEPGGMEAFVRNAETLLAEVPDAYIIVRIGLHPPVDWMEANRDELITYQDEAMNRRSCLPRYIKMRFRGCIPLLPGNGRKRQERP